MLKNVRNIDYTIETHEFTKLLGMAVDFIETNTPRVTSRQMDDSYGIGSCGISTPNSKQNSIRRDRPVNTYSKAEYYFTFELFLETKYLKILENCFYFKN